MKANKKIIRNSLGLIVFLLMLQTTTFYTIAERHMIKSLGKDYETYYEIDFEDNTLNNIVFISKLPVNEYLVQKYFKSFQNREIKVCSFSEDCVTTSLREDTFIYLVNVEMYHPFITYKVEEEVRVLSFNTI